MTETTAVIIGASIGSGITGIFAIVSIWLQRRADERRQIRELAVKVAIENWKHGIEVAVASGKAVNLYPLDTYLIHAMSLVRALDGRIKTTEEVSVLLRESFAMAAIAKTETKTYTEQIKNQTK